MEILEILKKIEELKEIVRNAENLAREIELEVASKATETMDAIDDCLDKGKEMDRAEYLILSQQNARIEEMKNMIETVAYKLSAEVAGNLNKIA